MKYDLISFNTHKRFKVGKILAVAGSLLTSLGIVELTGGFRSKSNFHSVTDEATNCITDLYTMFKDATKK